MSIFEFDKALREHAQGRFKRFHSFEEAGIPLSSWPWEDGEQEQAQKAMEEWKAKFVRRMEASFKKPARVRSEQGPFFNVEEALAGEAECFRRMRQVRKAPLRIGINMSRTSLAQDVVHVRGGALLAMIELAKRRGQATRIEVCYGNGARAMKPMCHVRILLQMPTPQTLSLICCASSGIAMVGRGFPNVRKIAGEWKPCKRPAGKLGPVEAAVGRADSWCGGYRFHEFYQDPKFPKEYDFVLDRIETNNAKVEEERVLKQLQAFALM